MSGYTRDDSIHDKNIFMIESHIPATWKWGESERRDALQKKKSTYKRISLPHNWEHVYIRLKIRVSAATSHPLSLSLSVRVIRDVSIKEN